MKAGKVLGVLLLIIGVLTVIAGVLIVGLPLVRPDALQTVLSAMQAHSEPAVGKIAKWICDNGLIVLCAGAALVLLAIVLLTMIASAARKKAKREAEKRRNQLMNQKENRVARNGNDARNFSASHVSPAPVNRQKQYVSPVAAARAASAPVKPPQAVQPVAYEKKPNPAAHERVSPNPYVRPLPALKETVATLKRTDIPADGRHMYAPPTEEHGQYQQCIQARSMAYQAMLQQQAAKPEQLAAQEMQNTFTSAATQRQEKLYSEHVAEESSRYASQPDRLMHRMEIVLADTQKQENNMYTGVQPQAQIWNLTADLTSMEAWNINEVQEADAEPVGNVFADSTNGIEEPEMTLPAVTEATVDTEAMPKTRSRMGRRAVVVENEIFPGVLQQDGKTENGFTTSMGEKSGSEKAGESMLYPASSRIRMTVGRNTSDS